MSSVSRSTTIEPFTAVGCNRPPFDQLGAFARILDGQDWPTLQELEVCLRGLRHPDTGTPLRFAAQDQRLLSDGLHYERRIAQQGIIATRPNNWHDLFNALVWASYPKLKLALNRLQVRDLGKGPRGNRTRYQQSLTHVDEAGLLVATEHDFLLDAIDGHDWHGLFAVQRAAWGTHICVHVFGHALFDLARKPHLTLAGKALLFKVPPGFCGLPFHDRAQRLDACAAQAVSEGRLAADPADMPSLPLAGIPGWRADNEHADFIRHAPCFRPKPENRTYSAPVTLG